MPYRIPPTSQRLYPPTKMATLATLLGDAGVPAEAVLHGTGLDAAALQDVTCLTAIGQYLTVCRNAIALAADATLPFRAGAQSHLSDHGMVGLLLLSSGSVRDYFRLAVQYQLLATPTLAIDGIEDNGHALRLLPDDTTHDWPEGLRRFLVEQQVAQQVAQLNELLGRPCPPTLAYFDYPAPAHRALYSRYLQCPCVFDWHRCELRYADELLIQRPQLANPLGAAVLQASCDALVADMEASLGVAGEVYQLLRRTRDPGASMKTVASEMKITDRTLRRRLADEGTSFSTILHDVKYRVAAQHLTGSAASIDQVAAIAGFSDTANFRRAFIRWTNMSPAQFRRLQHR